jgi:hypothetical protein
LPRDFRLASGDVIVELDYARKAEITSSLKRMLQSAAERADNVGIDEFDGHNHEFFVEFAEVFVAR